jgi:hypothetical protein
MKGTGDISVRVRHPNRNLSFLEELLGLSCLRRWTVGEQRTTPVGTPLGGYYDESYWVAGIKYYPSEEPFNQSLDNICEKLAHAKDCLKQIISTGGSIVIYFALAGHLQNYGKITPTQIALFADIGIEIEIEIYCKPQR